MNCLEEQHSPSSYTVESGQARSAAGRPARDVSPPYRILVADDNEVNVKVGLLQLRQLGYRADAVNDGIEVLAALERQNYDLILMDCHMPRMDGYQATRELRLRHGNRPHIPVIGMTANALLGNRERCLAAGMDDYINKPVNSDALGKLLAKWLAPVSVSGAEPIYGDTKAAQRDEAHEVSPEMLEMTSELTQIGAYVGADSVAEIVGLFVEDAPKRLRAVEDAFNEGDIEALEKAAHALRGSCLYLKATKMAALCDTIEAFCGRCELVAESAINDLREETWSAIEALVDARSRYISLINR